MRKTGYLFENGNYNFGTISRCPICDTTYRQFNKDDDVCPKCQQEIVDSFIDRKNEEYGCEVYINDVWYEDYLDDEEDEY